MGFEYDEIDVAILRILSRNARLSYRQISTRLGIHPNTAITRIKRLEDNGIIERYTIRVNYRKLDFRVHAIIQVDVKGMTDVAAKRIAKLPWIHQLYRTTGEYDLIAITICKDMEDLNKLINEMTAFPFVQSCNTKIVLETFATVPDF